MGVLKQPDAAKSARRRLPGGAFTVDSRGNLVSSTVPRWFPEELALRIGGDILAVFKGAAAVRLPCSQLRVQYEAFSISAREMRGGAIIFLSPKPAARPPALS
jgi:hypothetical protein